MSELETKDENRFIVMSTVFYFHVGYKYNHIHLPLNVISSKFKDVF